MLSTLSRHSILYVEDESEIRDNIAEYLGNYFHTIHLAADGIEALDKYNKLLPDVLLLDINLPNIDGLYVAQEVRKIDPNVKIIILTAFTEKDKLLKATELKLTRYLVKPVAPKDFKEALRVLASELMNNPTRFFRLCDEYTWDIEHEYLSHDGKKVILSEKEHRLLKLFVSNRGKSVRYHRIVSTVWGDTFDREVSMDSVKNQVSQLRKKIPNVNITSIYGEGYILS